MDKRPFSFYTYLLQQEVIKVPDHYLNGKTQEEYFEELDDIIQEYGIHFYNFDINKFDIWACIENLKTFYNSDLWQELKSTFEIYRVEFSIGLNKVDYPDMLFTVRICNRYRKHPKDYFDMDTLFARLQDPDHMQEEVILEDASNFWVNTLYNGVLGKLFIDIYQVITA